jgi:hypothetical protein
MLIEMKTEVIDSQQTIIPVDRLYLHKKSFMSKSPIPENENERLLSLANLDLDYTDLEWYFKEIVALTSKITGMDISLINLIDPFTQWTIARHGLELDSLPREESVCQYTIMADIPFEVSDLSADKRFQERSYVQGSPNLKYYLGIPLTTDKGINIGSLCVLDSELKAISSETKEILKLLAQEVVNKLKTYNTIATLKNKLRTAGNVQKKLAHDVRDPLAGIVGISEILLEQGCESKEETLEYIGLINESSKLILDVTDEVLIEEAEEEQSLKGNFNLFTLNDKLEQLYHPFAKKKNIQLNFIIEPNKKYFPLPKSSVLQIAGTLISSAIQLLPPNETITTEIDINVQPEKNSLNIKIKGSASPLVLNDNALYKQVKLLTVEMVNNLNGKLEFSEETDEVLYTLILPFKG